MNNTDTPGKYSVAYSDNFTLCSCFLLGLTRFPITISITDYIFITVGMDREWSEMVYHNANEFLWLSSTEVVQTGVILET